MFKRRQKGKVLQQELNNDEEYKANLQALRQQNSRRVENIKINNQGPAKRPPISPPSDASVYPIASEKSNASSGPPVPSSCRPNARPLPSVEPDGVVYESLPDVSRESGVVYESLEDASTSPSSSLTTTTTASTPQIIYDVAQPPGPPLTTTTTVPTPQIVYDVAQPPGPPRVVYESVPHNNNKSGSAYPIKPHNDGDGGDSRPTEPQVYATVNKQVPKEVYATVKRTPKTTAVKSEDEMLDPDVEYDSDYENTNSLTLKRPPTKTATDNTHQEHSINSDDSAASDDEEDPNEGAAHDSNQHDYENYPLPEGLTKEKNDDIEKAYVHEWLKHSLDRSDAQTAIKDSGMIHGCYLVRKSQGGTFGLTICANKNIFHMKIMTELSSSLKAVWFVQGDKSEDRQFSNIWDLLVHYKQPTPRLKWHLSRCISTQFIKR